MDMLEVKKFLASVKEQELSFIYEACDRCGVSHWFISHPALPRHWSGLYIYDKNATRDELVKMVRAIKYLYGLLENEHDERR